MNNFIEIPASKNSLANRKSIYGIGTNDAKYAVKPKINGKRSYCPYYKVWHHMMERSYSQKFQDRNPSYAGCSAANEWLVFSIFREWMETQDWEGKQLDKDIIISGNKIYGPAACIFVSGKINTLFTDAAAIRGDLPQGVSLDKRTGKYRSYCMARGHQNHLGYFSTINEAEYTYL